MRTFLLLLILCLLPTALADGWYYPGDTFEEDGVVYSVEGSNEQSVLFGVGGQLFLIPLYGCKEHGLSEYCYTSTAYPDDEDHIKYEAGEKYYGYYITIVTFEPSISVSRDVSEESPDLNEQIEIAVTIENTGDYNVRDIVYEEAIPAGLKVVSGPVAGAKVLRKVPVLSVGAKERFTYKVQPVQFGEFMLKPTVTYVHEGISFNESVDEERIEVDTPLDVDIGVSPELNIDETGHYWLNVTNLDKSTALDVELSLSVPAAVTVKSLDGFVKQDGALTKKLTLDPEEEAQLSFSFSTANAESFTLPLSVSISAPNFETTQEYSKSVSVKGDRLDATITVSPVRDAYYPGTDLTISGVLENGNDEVAFNTIKGKLSSVFFQDVPFSHESFPVKKKLTEASALVTVPDVNESTVFAVTFAGTYNSPSGRLFSFSAEKKISVAPKTTSVNVIRTVEPAAPERGSTVKVTVRAKNLVGQYVALDIHEKYASELVKTSGLTFAEVSFDRDEEQQLYIYELEIPGDFPGDRFNLTTVVRVKDQQFAEEYPTEVVLAGGEQSAPVEDAVIELEDVDEDTGEDGKKELGFFAAIWDFFKGLFS